MYIHIINIKYMYIYSYLYIYIYMCVCGKMKMFQTTNQKRIRLGVLLPSALDTGPRQRLAQAPQVFSQCHTSTAPWSSSWSPKENKSSLYH